MILHDASSGTIVYGVSLFFVAPLPHQWHRYLSCGEQPRYTILLLFWNCGHWFYVLEPPTQGVSHLVHGPGTEYS